MPRGSSNVSRNSGMRETPAASNVCSSSQMGSLSSTAMISARGTIMSSTRKPPKRRMRSSISRSSSEKAAAVAGIPLRASSSISRRVGAPAGPSRARSRASCAAARQPAPRGLGILSAGVVHRSACSWHCMTIAREWRCSDDAGSVGIGDAERCQNLDLEALHHRASSSSRDRSRADAGGRARPNAGYGARREAVVGGLALRRVSARARRRPRKLASSPPGQAARNGKGQHVGRRPCRDSRG